MGSDRPLTPFRSLGQAHTRQDVAPAPASALARCAWRQFGRNVCFLPLLRVCTISRSYLSTDDMAERSKAVASGAIPKGRGFKSLCRHDVLQQGLLPGRPLGGRGQAIIPLVRPSELPLSARRTACGSGIAPLESRRPGCACATSQGVLQLAGVRVAPILTLRLQSHFPGPTSALSDPSRRLPRGGAASGCSSRSTSPQAGGSFRAPLRGHGRSTHRRRVLQPPQSLPRRAGRRAGRPSPCISISDRRFRNAS